MRNVSIQFGDVMGVSGNEKPNLVEKALARFAGVCSLPFRGPADS